MPANNRRYRKYLDYDAILINHHIKSTLVELVCVLCELSHRHEGSAHSCTYTCVPRSLSRMRKSAAKHGLLCCVLFSSPTLDECFLLLFDGVFAFSASPHVQLRSSNVTLRITAGVSSIPSTSSIVRTRKSGGDAILRGLVSTRSNNVSRSFRSRYYRLVLKSC